MASNAEEFELAPWLTMARRCVGRAFSKGKNERYKTYDFLPDYILRVRATTRPAPPCPRPVAGSSRKKIPYPALAPGVVVTDAYALVLLASVSAAPPRASARWVNTEFNFTGAYEPHGRARPQVGLPTGLGAGAISGSPGRPVASRCRSAPGEQRESPTSACWA